MVIFHFFSSSLRTLCPKLHYTHHFALIEFFPQFFVTIPNPIPVVDNTCEKTPKFPYEKHIAEKLMFEMHV